MAFKKSAYLLPLLLVILGVTVGAHLFGDFFDGFGIFGDRDKLEAFLAAFGPFAPSVIVVLIVIEVIVAPLPGGVFSIVSGILWGPVLGVLYSWLGNVAGSAVAFALARQYGERMVTYFVPSFERERYGREIEGHSYPLFALYALPIAPVDVLSFAFGLSRIPFRRFMTAIAAGFVVRMMIWVLFGDALAEFLFI